MEPHPPLAPARREREPFLETEHLRLRPLSATDLDHLVQLDADPEVRRYLDLPHPPSRTDVAAQLPRLLQRFGGYEPAFWAAEDRATGSFYGWFHLRPLEEEPGSLDLGYRLRREAWGRGLATQGSRALVERAFRHLGAERVTAHALQANLASRRVMEKVGLRPQRAYLYRGELPAVSYSLRRADFLGRSSA